MVRTLYVFLLLFLLPGKSAYSQSKASFLVYEKDTINRVNENGLKTGPWVYFYRDSTIQVQTTISYDCYKMNNGSSQCVRTEKYDTIYRHCVNEVRARGNYVQNLREGIWRIGENDVFDRHAEIVFSHDTISRMFPIQIFNNSHSIFYSIAFVGTHWEYCHVKDNVWKEDLYWTCIDEFLDDYLDYKRINYPSKFTAN
ncbi:hypothetical protein [Taibaiella soli]|uniref:Uncharacterized protein n=1 Tax=Taibaiella soli TaxID=1649169 RepID=A0A2W2AD66_9BACT|nr:hypothetical protein [Taibaiella soli]PZF73191.1 hypothetical protein DN068_09985 [Taibaiella soli]